MSFADLEIDMILDGDRTPKTWDDGQKGDPNVWLDFVCMSDRPVIRRDVEFGSLGTAESLNNNNLANDFQASIGSPEGSILAKHSLPPIN